MKKILLLALLASTFFYACNKDQDQQTLGPRFEIVGNKSYVRGNLVTARPLTDSNVFVLAYKNAPAGTSALISSDTVNGMYIKPVTLTIGGDAITNIKISGVPTTDGAFVMNLKVKIDGTTYISSKEFYVDEPNYTSITLTATDTSYYNITTSTGIPFKITPKSTVFNMVVPAHITANITNVSGTDRLLTVVPDGQFISGDVVITATFTGLPTVVKTFHLTAFSAGKGTAASPFEITDSARLNRVAYALNQSYKLMADVTQTSSTTSASVFSGNFDGNGKKIINCTINVPTTNQVGYFSDIASGGTVKDLTLSNVSVTGQDYVGAVAGANHGTITNVTVTGNIKGRTYVGGIAGNNFGTISSCDITNANVSGTNNIGSLAGNTNTGSSEAANSLLIVPATFPTEVYGVTASKVVDFSFAPSDGTVVVQSAPAGLTAVTVAGQQKVTLTPQAGFISGPLQLSLQKNKLSATRTVMINYALAGAFFTGGDGSVSNPYLVPTENALLHVRDDASKNYKIIADITLTAPWVPMPSFSGTLDGQSFKVSNMTINSTTANDGFVNTLTGTIKNIQFLNVNCTTTAAFGVIAGKNNGGTLQNLTVSGTVTSTNTADVLGGVAGELATGGKITQCYTKLAITASCGMVGGIAGRLTTATGVVAEISNCTSAGTITITAAKNRIAGILARAEGTVVGGGIVKNCSSSVAISSTGLTATSVNGVGGIFGADQNAGIVPIDQCMFTGSIVTGFSIGGIAGVGSTISNCLVAGTTATPLLLSSTGTPATGVVGGIAGTNKVSLSKCVVKNTSLRATTTTVALPMAGLVSTYQNSGYSTSSLVINTSIEGSNTAPNAVNVFRIAGAAGGSPGNTNNYAGPNVTAQFRTPTAPFVDDANGLDGMFSATFTQSFLQGLGYDMTTVWKIDSDGYPALRNAGYNGSLPIPQ